MYGYAHLCSGDPIMMATICDTEGSALTMYSHGTTIVGEKKWLGIYWYQQLEV